MLGISMYLEITARTKPEREFERVEHFFQIALPGQVLLFVVTKCLQC